jgi:hypothetical protein
MLMDAFTTDTPEAAETPGESRLVPEEWEEPLFAILTDEEQGLAMRNARLIELATGPARNEPTVQEECMLHLLFGLADSDGAKFLLVVTNPAIPVEMRADFLREVLAMRPIQTGEWLSEQISSHHEPAISSTGRLYLRDLQDRAK